MSIKLSLEDQPNPSIVQETKIAQDLTTGIGNADGMEYTNRAVGQAEKRLVQLFDEELATPRAGATPSSSLTDSIIGRFEEEQKAVLEQAPNEQVRQSLQNKFSGIAERGIVRAIGTEQVQKVAARADSAEQTLDIYRDLAKRDPDEAQIYLAQGNQLLEEMRHAGIKGEAIDKRGQDFRAAIMGASFDGVVERDPEEAISRFEDGEFDELFNSPEEKENAKAKLNKVIEVGQSSLMFRAEQQEQESSKLQEARRLLSEAELDQKLDDGSADQDEITKAYWRGDIDEQDTEHLLRKFRAKSDANWAKQGQVKRIASVLKNGEILDVSDPMAVASANTFFDEIITPNVTDLDPIIRQRVEDLFIRKTGTLPSEVIKPIRGALLAGEPEEQVAAAERLATLMKSAPEISQNIAGQLNPVEMIKVKILAELTDIRIPPEKAVPLATKKVQALMKSGALANRPLGANEQY